MKRETLLEMVRRAQGAETGAVVKFPEDHEITFYLGEAGQAMAVRRVSECRLEPEFVEVTSLDPEARWYVTYDSVFGVQAKALKDRSSRRAGF